MNFTLRFFIFCLQTRSYKQYLLTKVAGTLVTNRPVVLLYLLSIHLIILHNPLKRRLHRPNQTFYTDDEFHTQGNTKSAHF